METYLVWKNDKHQCPAGHPDRSGTVRCLKQEDHTGPHRDIFGVEWTEYDKGNRKFNVDSFNGRTHAR